MSCRTLLNITKLCSGPPAAGLVAEGLKVEDLRRLEARRQGVLDRPQAQHGREVAHAPVQLGQQRGSAVVQARQVDQQRLGLPLLGGEAGGVGQRDDLRRERLLEVELAGDVNDAGDRLAGEARDLSELVGGEGVGEVEEEHGLCDLCIGHNCHWVDGHIMRVRKRTAIACTDRIVNCAGPEIIF